ncbi:beta-lactamase family protein [Chloroflexi bacterium TSY]|nr:beta-lactamase family protein [Chloroflexi bacterium TSY]
MIELASPESVGLSSQRLGYIPDHLNQYVDSGKIPGYLVLVSRRSQPVYLCSYGLCDVETKKPVEEETIFRIYSMTKPITSVALMTLYERGMFQLDHPVSKFIPEFKDLAVFSSGADQNYETVPAEREMTVRDLLTHTSGLTYGFMNNHPVDAMYRERDIQGESLTKMIQHLSEIPLLFSPGTRWSYSVATDVLGYLIEVLSGQRLDRFFQKTIFDPLSMNDTGFVVPADKVQRFAANYERDGNSFRLIDRPAESKYLSQPSCFSGGGGLVSTAADYFRFTQMLLNKGVLNGKRVLGRKTVELMTSNHLPTGGDLTSMGQAVFSETPYDGIGFGLGFSVMLDPARAQILGSPGESAWGGAASTAFWVDFAEEMSMIFLTQLMPSSSYPIRRELRVLTYQAIVD